MTEESLTPSRVIESLLTGLGARADITDAVLGDLHQKLTTIAETNGARAARRWYRREALRAAPHLLLDGLRSLHVAEGRRLLNVGLLSIMLTVTLVMMVSLAGVAFIWAFAGPRFPLAEPGQTIMVVYVDAVVLIAPFLTGFIAATLEEKTPLIAALAVAAGCAAWILLVSQLHTRPRLPVPIEMVFPTVGYAIWAMIACVIGGSLCVGRRRSPSIE